ncbi:MAG TPA: zinc-binding dehydrogenase [Candidatus Baltobacteraceae bacterium]|nr:zinc-binding dehydrogenase [Candidatus Baltobacteraceae bacterium]
MRAIQYDRFGEPGEVVAPATIDTPKPGAEEVLVRVRLSPVHNHDLATIRGIYGVKPSLPAIGGSELVGEVDGKRVAVLTRGAWAEYAIAHPDALVPIPDAIPDEIAAQLLAMPMSAIALFDGLHVSKGDWIVQNAANGAVGHAIEAIAKKAGVNVVNLVRREAAAEELRSHGARAIVQNGDWVARVREVSGGAPIVRVIDSVCDENSLALNRLLAPGGEHVVFGALARRPLSIDPGSLIYGQTHVRGFWMITWMLQSGPEEKRAAVTKAIGLALDGQLDLPVAGSFPLERAADAMREAERPGRPGKVLISASA